MWHSYVGFFHMGGAVSRCWPQACGLVSDCQAQAAAALSGNLSDAPWPRTTLLRLPDRINDEKLSHPGFSIPALLLLVGGLAGIAFDGRFSEMIRDQREKEVEEGDPPPLLCCTCALLRNVSMPRLAAPETGPARLHTGRGCRG